MYVCLKPNCVLLFQKGRYVIAPTTFLNKGCLTEFMGSRAAALRTIALLHVLFTAIRFVIYYSLACSKHKKTPGFSNYPCKEKEVAFELDLILLNYSEDKVRSIFSCWSVQSNYRFAFNKPI